MDLNKFESIEYNKPEKRLAVTIINNNNYFFGIWLEDGQIMLEASFSKKDKQLTHLDGVVGKEIKNANISDKLKVERVGEAFSNALWEHYYAPQPTQKKKI